MLAQSEEGSIEVDVFDKQILFHLSKGTKPRDFPIHPNFLEQSITENQI
jgi:hypothetical protein